MSAIRVVVLGVVMGALPAAAFAQTPPAAQNQAAQQPAQPAPAQAEPTKPAQPAAGGDKKAPSVTKPSDDEFIPSEELSPDEEVTFPVDI